MWKHGVIEIKEVQDGFFMVFHTKTRRYVKLGKMETDFLKYLLTSETTKNLDDIDASSFPFTQEQVAYIIDKFQKWGFVGEQAETHQPKSFQKLRNLDITALKFLTFNPDPLLNRIQPLIRILWNPWFALLLFACSFGTVGYVINEYPDSLLSVNIADIRWTDLVILYVSLFFTTILHELSHAMSCKYFGGRVNKLGFMLFYLQPAMYCDISASYLFPKRRQKVLVAFAGILTQWVLIALVLASYAVIYESNGHAPRILIYYVILNLGITVVNMVPFVKMDGYWILSHLLNVTNLRDKSFRYLFASLMGKQALLFGEAGRKEKAAFLIYGLIAAVFTPLFWGTGWYQMNLHVKDYLGVTGQVGVGILAVIISLHFIKFVRTNILYVQREGEAQQKIRQSITGG